MFSIFRNAKNSSGYRHKTFFEVIDINRFTSKPRVSKYIFDVPSVAKPVLCAYDVHHLRTYDYYILVEIVADPVLTAILILLYAFKDQYLALGQV